MITRRHSSRHAFTGQPTMPRRPHFHHQSLATTLTSSNLGLAVQRPAVSQRLGPAPWRWP